MSEIKIFEVEGSGMRFGVEDGHLFALPGGA